MSKKELYKRVLELEKENERLKEENAYLRFEIEELRTKRYKPKKENPPTINSLNQLLKRKAGFLAT